MGGERKEGSSHHAGRGSDGKRSVSSSSEELCRTSSFFQGAGGTLRHVDVSLKSLLLLCGCSKKLSFGAHTLPPSFSLLSLTRD